MARIGKQDGAQYENGSNTRNVGRRSSDRRPTCILSSLDHAGKAALLGEGIMNRMRLGNSLWVRFDWESYRSRVRGDEY